MIRLLQLPVYDADVLIIGAGPAGATCAAHLARRGVRVLLLDRQAFPRDKVCGDFVGPAALMELQRLGITEWPAYDQTNTIGYAALYVDGKELIRHPIPEIEGLPRTGKVIKRIDLDHWILRAAEEAGAEVLTRAKVVDVCWTPNGVSVRTNIEGKEQTLWAKVVVGADGAGSLVARKLRGAGPTDFDKIIAVRAYYSEVEGAGDTCDLYFSGESFPGYYWLFPTSETTANVGIGMVLETLPPTDDHLRDLLTRLVETDPALRARLGNAKMQGKIVGWPLTTFNSRLSLARDRTVLIGDAAGLINPLNGEGIQYAMLSGRWAADTLQAALQTNDLSNAMLGHYSAKVHQEMRYDMALAGTIVQLIRNRRLNPAWLYALKIIVARASRDDNYASIVGGILAGIVPASEAMCLRVLGGTATQAAITTAWTVAQEALKGPNVLLDHALSTAEMLAGVLGDAADNPKSFARWATGVGLYGVELAGQVMSHTIKAQRNGNRSAGILSKTGL